MEDGLKIVKVKYLSNHRSDLIQIKTYAKVTKLNLENISNEYDLQWKMSSKYLYKEISSVALLTRRWSSRSGSSKTQANPLKLDWLGSA